MIPFIKLRKVWYVISGVLVALSIVGILVYGLPYGIDFTGGTILEVSYTKDVPELNDVRDVFPQLDIHSASIQRAENGYIIRMPEISEEKHQEIIRALRLQIGQSSEDEGVSITPSAGSAIGLGDVDLVFEGEDGETSQDQNRVIEQRFDTVGPVIGRELKVRSIEALILVLLAIMAYVAWAFRKVSWPVKSWKYGAIAVLALFQDVIITLGAYVWAASFTGWEIDTVFIAALLTVLGYSVNDSIVIFDRVRENLPRLNENFDDIVNTSLNQTLARSINTGVTTVLVLLAIFIFGGESLKPFMFALIVGISMGAYSSIFVASPLLVTWHNWAATGKKGK